MPCPRCHLRPIGLSIYSNCQHCGWSLQNSQREIHSNQELILQGIINDNDRRIAELEAEVERLKDMHKAKWKDAYSRICANTTEEGEG